ncbi:MAG: hypothetical protein ACM3X1_01995 [Ignavibacteriales bacterium]
MYEAQLGYGTNIQQFELLAGLPFYNRLASAGSLTFNHAIGLPLKNGSMKLLTL